MSLCNAQTTYRKVVVIVGAGLVGSTVLRYLADADDKHMALIVVDPDIVEASTRRAAVFRDAEEGTTKVAWLLRTLPAKNAWRLGVEKPVQALGEGFWLWLVGQSRDVRILDCADTSSAHYFLADLPRRLIEPAPTIIQTGVGGPRGTVRVFPPAPSVACFRCLGIRANDRRNSCLSGTPLNPGEAPPTRAAAGVADVVAALAVAHVFDNEPPSTSCEFRLSLVPSERDRRIALLRNPACDHSRLSANGVVAISASSSTPLAELFAVAGDYLEGLPLVLRSRLPIATRNICPDCGTERHKPAALGTGRRYVCGHCRSEEMLADENSLTHELGEEQAGPWSPADIGLPLWSWLTFASPRGEEVTFELAGDAEALVGERE